MKSFFFRNFVLLYFFGSIVFCCDAVAALDLNTSNEGVYAPKKQYYSIFSDILKSAGSTQKAGQLDLSGMSNADLKAMLVNSKDSRSNQLLNVSDAGLQYLSAQFCPRNIKLDQLQKCASFSVELAQSDKLLSLALSNFQTVGSFCIDKKLFPNPDYGLSCNAAALWAGLLYFHGQGASVDYQKSFYWLSKGNPALDSNGNAQFVLGYLYGSGLGTSVDYQKAIYWYNASLVLLPGGAGTLTNLAGVYQKVGEYQLAYQTALKAAKLGSPLAQYFVANFYYTGQGVLVNEIQAYAWVSLAVATGFDSQNYSNASQLQDQAIYMREAIKQDLIKSGELKQAQALAEKYYDMYVLGKVPPQPKKSLLDTLKDYWKNS